MKSGRIAPRRIFKSFATGKTFCLNGSTLNVSRIPNACTRANLGIMEKAHCDWLKFLGSRMQLRRVL